MKSEKLSLDVKAKGTLAEVRRAALNLLARREHSLLEMHHKLSHRGYAPTLIAAALEGLVADDLLNEHRYAELYAHSRVDKGYGPLRIDRELRERGISGEIIAVILNDLKDYWMAKLVELRRKRFGAVIPKSTTDLAQQIRFLRYRGFTSEQITRVLCDL